MLTQHNIVNKERGTMSDKIISKSEIQDYLRALAEKFTVVAPMPRRDAPAEFVEINSGDEPILAGSRPMMPPKDYLLPRYETLLKVDRGPEGIKIESAIPEDKPRVMLGVWLPDAQAIQVLDRVFLDKNFVDPYYAARRRNTLIAAVIPREPRWSWFCSSVDDVEEWRKNVDAIFYDLGDRYFVEPKSEKGQALVNLPMMTEAGDEDKVEKDKVWQRFVEQDILPFARKALYEQLEWDNPIWAEIAQKCLGCGICSYMCPSCSCFDIRDDMHDICIERYRCRDTCQFEDFTLMGAGHNPRSTQLPRSRQRLLHKFKYQHEQFGVVGCTGCGRCVELCPVNVDIRDILSRTCANDMTEPVA